MKKGNVGKRILDQGSNTISKSTHHKGGPCLQLPLYIKNNFSKNDWSGNKGRKEDNENQKGGRCLQLQRMFGLGIKGRKEKMFGGEF